MMKQRSLSLRDFLLILIVVILWGCNFVAIKIGLSGFPPLFLVGVRFLLVFFPACLWIKRPNLPWQYLFRYGFFMGIAQFGFLFYAIQIGMPAGIASVLIQAQVMFGLPLAALLLHEKITRIQIGGILLSVFGVLYLGGVFQSDRTLPLLPFFLVILAAASFGVSNVVYRQIAEYNIKQGKRTSSLEVLVWSSLFIPLPMFALSAVLETPQVVFSAVMQLKAPALLSLAYMVILSTFVAYGLWASLIGKYSASLVSPFSLLVPLVGVLASVTLLHETLDTRQITGMVITIAGLALANLGTRLVSLWSSHSQKEHPAH